jgi:hypothetical protein
MPNISSIYQSAKEHWGLLQLGHEWLTLLDYLSIASPTPKSFLEIGTAKGGSLFCFASLFEGPFISIDNCFGNFGGIGDRAAANQRNAALRSTFPHREFKFFEGSSHSLLMRDSVADYLKQTPSGPLVDVLFIDGDHSEIGTLCDFALYSPLVNPNGYIIFHDIKDTDLHRNAKCFVAEVWKHIKKIYPASQIRTFLDPQEDWGGIGMIYLQGETHKQWKKYEVGKEKEKYIYDVLLPNGKVYLDCWVSNDTIISSDGSRNSWPVSEVLIRPSGRLLP